MTRLGKSHLRKRVITPEGKEKIRLNGLAEWLAGAQKRHGDKFSYEKAKEQFRRQKEPSVEILCNEHRRYFTTTPHNHLRAKNGCCPDCDNADAIAIFREKEGSKFFKWFAENRAERLEIRSSFNGMTSLMTFFCKAHNKETSTFPTSLFNNDAYGCDQCAREAVGLASRLSEKAVFDELNSEMPDHIQIKRVYFDQKTKKSMIEILCEEHGLKNVTKGYLKRSNHKCPDCGDENVGYTSHRLARLIEAGTDGKPAFLGIMEINVFGINTLKVGVTTRTLEDRYKHHLKVIKFSVKTTEKAAYVIENKIHRAFRNEHDLRILKEGMRRGERWAGDTECYWMRNEKGITDLIKNILEYPKRIDYREELTLYEVPNFFPRDVSREKDLTNQPIKIVAVDPDTGEIKHEFNSIGEAQRAGFSGARSAVSIKGRRGLSGGFRWFRKAEYETKVLEPVPEKKLKTRGVVCVESQKAYPSITSAVRSLIAEGVSISAPHITAVCKGQRKRAGGYKWKYLDVK